ncbi:MAG TPA: c-type cytochrome [Steroidobacteraceae bacterium]|nr:c-type cytochrome [Steroidobacteraceae bacterium]
MGRATSWRVCALGLALVLSLLLPTAAACAASDYAQELTAALTATPDAESGARIFALCAACHDEDGAGTVDGQVPRIAGQSYRMLVTQLMDFRYSRRWDLRMEQLALSHRIEGAQGIADVADHVNRLPIRGPIGTGDGTQLAHGHALYVRRCQSCHGAAGQGNDAQGVPQLSAQHFAYLLRQMHDAVEGRRPHFPSAHVELLDKLVRDDLVGVADYLSRLPPAIHVRGD